MRFISVVSSIFVFSQVAVASPKIFECDSPGVAIRVQEGGGDYLQVVNKSSEGNHPEAEKFNVLMGLPDVSNIEMRFDSTAFEKCSSESLAAKDAPNKSIFSCLFRGSDGTLTGSDKLIRNLTVDSEIHEINSVGRPDREEFKVRIIGNYNDGGKWKEFRMTFDDQTICRSL